jgi:fructose-1,6-bisphosphatase
MMLVITMVAGLGVMEVKAEVEVEEHDEPDGDEAPGAVDGEEQVKTEEPAEEQLAGDLSELEDVAEDVSEELEVEEEDPSETFAAVLASMHRKAGRK